MNRRGKNETTEVELWNASKTRNEIIDAKRSINARKSSSFLRTFAAKKKSF
jgi:hypothetical protein